MLTSSGGGGGCSPSATLHINTHQGEEGVGGTVPQLPSISLSKQKTDPKLLLLDNGLGSELKFQVVKKWHLENTFPNIETVQVENILSA